MILYNIFDKIVVANFEQNLETFTLALKVRRRGVSLPLMLISKPISHILRFICSLIRFKWIELVRFKKCYFRIRQKEAYPEF